MDFVETVLHLCDCCRYVPPPAPIQTERKASADFKLPERNANNDRVIEYLLKRGLSGGLIRACINTGRLFEDRLHNCCFVGFDADGVPRYAMLRSSLPTSSFLREVEGSDKRYSFCLSFQPSITLYLFEGAIDTLSYVELQLMQNADWKKASYLSLSGIYRPRKELSETPLPAALSQFITDNPSTQHIVLCLDNDEAGRKAAMAICALLPERYTSELLPP